MSQCKSVLSSAVVSCPGVRPLLALIMTAVLSAGSASAQIRAPQPVPGPAVTSGTAKTQPTTITYKQKTTFDFDDDQVEGSVVQPDSDLVTGRSKSKHDSLVRARTTFQPEMLKSVESL